MNNKGFTLIELLVVTSIIGLFAVMVSVYLIVVGVLVSIII